MEFKHILIRALFITFLLSFLTYNSITNFTTTNEDPICIVDYSQSLFTNFYKFFEKNVNSKKFLLITIGIILDFSMILTSYAWIKFSKSWRTFVIFIIYIVILSISKFIFKMKIPERNLLEFPGIPSLLITYNTNVNNFFPGSIGLSLFAAMELKNYKNFNLIFNIMSWCSYINVILQTFIYMSIRAIYFIDIICPIISLHYSVFLSIGLCKYLDDNYAILNEEGDKEREQETNNEIANRVDININYNHDNINNYSPYHISKNTASVTSYGSKLSNVTKSDNGYIEKKESDEKKVDIGMENL